MKDSSKKKSKCEKNSSSSKSKEDGRRGRVKSIPENDKCFELISTTTRKTRRCVAEDSNKEIRENMMLKGGDNRMQKREK